MERVKWALLVLPKAENERSFILTFKASERSQLIFKRDYFCDRGCTVSVYRLNSGVLEHLSTFLALPL